MIKRVDRTKSLGLTIDDRLSWSNHVDEICHFISANTSLQIYNALILPHFDYCSPVWDCLSGQSSDKLQTFQNRAARVITKLPFDTSANLLDTLKWEKLSLRRKKQKALIMYKTIHDLAPEYLQRLFSQRDA